MYITYGYSRLLLLQYIHVKVFKFHVTEETSGYL